MNLFRLSGSPGGETDHLVSLITRQLDNIGLSSYVTIYKVHWAANVSTFCFLTSCVLIAIGFVVVKDDPDRFFEWCSILAFCGMGIPKLLSLRLSHQSWRKLFVNMSLLENIQMNKDSISHAEYQSDSEEEDNHSVSVNIYTNKYRNTRTILTTIYNCATVFLMLTPYVEHFLCKIRGLECLGYPHILPVWAPLDDLGIFGYIVTILFEFVASVYCVTLHVVFDLTAIGVMIFLCGHFSMLRDFSSRIGGKGKSCNLSKKRDERAHYRIVRCHQIHCLLVKLVSSIPLNSIQKHCFKTEIVFSIKSMCPTYHSECNCLNSVLGTPQ